MMEDVVIIGLFLCEVIVVIGCVGGVVVVVVVFVDWLDGMVDFGVLFYLLICLLVLMYFVDVLLLEFVVILVIKLGSWVV